MIDARTSLSDQQSPPYGEQVGGPATFFVDRLEILLLVRPLGFLYLADAGWATAAVSAPLARVSWDGDSPSLAILLTYTRWRLSLISRNVPWNLDGADDLRIR